MVAPAGGRPKHGAGGDRMAVVLGKKAPAKVRRITLFARWGTPEPFFDAAAELS